MAERGSYASASAVNAIREHSELVGFLRRMELLEGTTASDRALPQTLGSRTGNGDRDSDASG